MSATRTWQEEDGAGADIWRDASARRDPADVLAAVIRFLGRARIAMAIGLLVGVIGALCTVAIGPPAYTATAKVLLAPGEADDGAARSSVRRMEGLDKELALLRSKRLLRGAVARANLHSHPGLLPYLSGPDGGPVATLRGFPRAMMRLVGLRPAQAGDVLAPDEAGEAAWQHLAGGLRLDAVPGSSVLAIAATTANPNLSAAVVNALAAEFLAVRRAEMASAAREATARLAERVAGAEADLWRAEAEAERRRAAAASADADASAVEAELEALRRSLAAAATARSAAAIRYRTIRRAIDEGAKSADLAASHLIRDARARVRELVSERAVVARRVPVGDSRLLQLDERIIAGRREIAAEAERIALARYGAMTIEATKERRLREASRKAQARLEALGTRENALRTAERAVTAARIIHQTFRVRLEEAAQREVAREADVVILAPGEPPAAADGRPRLAPGAFGGFLGLIGGLAVALVTDRLNRSFRSFCELEELTGLPVLAAIPRPADPGEQGDPLDAEMARPASRLAGAVRNLRAAIEATHGRQGSRVIAFTSSVPSEGRSTTSLLLGVMNARMGQSTIVVDCNLERTNPDGALGAIGAARGGLRAVLGDARAFEQACLVDPQSGLAVLPAGLAAEDPAVGAGDPFASAGFVDLLALLRTRYERVILDAPAALSGGAAAVIARHADATLLCVRWDDTPRDTVRAGLAALAGEAAAMLGTVVTDIDPKTARREAAEELFLSDASCRYRMG